MHPIRARKSAATLASALSLAALAAAPALAAPGDLDPSFGTGGVVVSNLDPVHGSTIDSVAVQPDGKVVALERAFSTGINHVLRYDTNGQPDETFGNHGVANVPGEVGASAIALQQDGKIVIDGTGGDGDFAFVRLETDGSLDETFDGDSGTGNGIVHVHVTNGQDIPTAIAVDGNDRIVGVGLANTTDTSGGVGVVRLLAGGKQDHVFGGTGVVVFEISGAEDDPFALAIQPDNKIVVTGRDGSFPLTDTFVQRFTDTGTVDPTFGNSNIGRKLFDFAAIDDGFALAIQPNGRILVGSDVSKDPDRLLGLTPTAGLDPTFTGAGQTQLGFEVIAIVPVPDGRFYLVGDQKVDGLPALAVERRNADGTPDATFNGGQTVLKRLFAGEESFVESAALAPDGKVVVAGRTVANDLEHATVERFQVDPDPEPAPAPITEAPAEQPVAPAAQPAPVPALALSKLGLTHRRFAVARKSTAKVGVAARSRGTVFRYTLNRAATVSIRIKQLKAGARTTILRRASHSGTNRVRFSGRIGRRVLRPGRYRATLVARDGSGAKSKAVAIRFRILRG